MKKRLTPLFTPKLEAAVTALMDDGFSFYDACRYSLHGDIPKTHEKADEEISDLTAFFQALGEDLCVQWPKESIDKKSMESLYTPGERDALELLPFVSRKRKSCAKSNCRDWKFVVFNFLIAQGIPVQTARQWVQFINNYLNQ